MTDKKQYNAEQLDKRLEMMLRSEALLERADEHPDSRIRAAARLAKSKAPALSNDARERIREQMRQHQPKPATTAPDKTVVRPGASYWQGLAKLAAAVVLVFAMGLGTSTATANSLPGDVLYPVKRQVETIELNLAGNAAARAEVFLTQANRRLAETDALLERGEFQPDVMEDAISRLDQAVQLAESNRLYETQPGFAVSTRTTYDTLTSTLKDVPGRASVTASVLNNLEQTAFALSANTDVLQIPAEMQPESTPDPQPEPVLTEPAMTLPPSETPAETMTTVLTETPAATDAPAVTDVPVQVLYVNTSERVNIRSGPGTTYEVIGSLAPGAALTVIGGADGWQQIEFDGGEGWIADFLLSETEPVIVGGDEDDDNGDAPGNSDFGCEGPGNSCNAPGHSGDDDSPGNSGNAPGQGGNPPGNPNPPGQGGNPPGNPNPPGQGGNPPGNPNPPGQGGNPPGNR